LRKKGRKEKLQRKVLYYVNEKKTATSVNSRKRKRGEKEKVIAGNSS